MRTPPLSASAELESRLTPNMSLDSNYIDIGWHHDSRTGRIIIQSAEDNLGKGAAGQAIQSFNLMVGNCITDGLQNL